MWCLDAILKAVLLKTHYFLWFGALSGTLQYTAIFGQKHTGQSATNVGILLAIIPFTCLISKPTFCSIADQKESHKRFLLISLLTTLLAYGLFSSVPFLPKVLRWPLFCLFALVANNAQGVVISLTDGIVMREVTKLALSYGSVRVFGALGWGLCGLFAGYINTALLPWFANLDYMPSLTMFVVFMFLDIFLIFFRLKQSKQESTDQELKAVASNDSKEKKTVKPAKRESVWKDVKSTISRNPSCLRYIFIAMVMGILTAFHWSFFYWFLGTLAPNNTLLMGLCTVVQCLFGELPFFLLAQKIVNLIGPSLSLTISLLAFALRYLCYAYLINKANVYHVLFVELTQGPTFGLYYSVIATVAQEYSLKTAKEKIAEREAKEEDSGSPAEDPKERNYSVMQGIFSGAFEGAGLGLGSLLGGFLIDSSRIENIWLFGAIIALAVSAINLTVDLLCKIFKKPEVRLG